MKKRRFPAIWMVLFLLAGCLSGCGKAEIIEAGASGTKTGVKYTRADWIGDLGDKFGYLSYMSSQAYFSDVPEDKPYYAAVQACAEWGIITEQSLFSPDSEATWDYALTTAVRAIGEKKLQRAGIDLQAYDTLTDFYLTNIASVRIEDRNEAITAEEAAQVLNYALSYESGLELASVENIVFKDKVRQVSVEDILPRGDGESAYILGEQTYQAGDVLYYYDPNSGDEFAARVISVENNLLLYEEAGIDDVFDSIEVYGTYTPEISDISFSGVNLQMEQGPWQVNNNVGLYGPIKLFMAAESGTNILCGSNIEVYTDVGKDGAVFRVSSRDGSWSAEAGVRNFKVTAGVDYHFLNLKEAFIQVTYDDYVYMEAQGMSAATIPLGELKFRIATGLSAKVLFFMNVGVNGEITLDYRSSFLAGVWFEKGSGVSCRADSKTSMDFHAEVTAAAEPLVKASLILLGKVDVTHVKATTGIVVIAKTDADLLGDKPSCCDLHIYVPLRWAVNEDSCLAVDLFGKKMRLSKVVWDEEYSAIEWKKHYENGIEVAVCTRGPGEEIRVETTDKTGAEPEEYKIFDFEEITFDSIKLQSTMMFLEQGETLKIGFREIPKEGAPDSLIYEITEGSGVCGIDKTGAVTALRPGVANVRISTADGMYHAYLTVIVAEDYTISGFIPL